MAITLEDTNLVYQATVQSLKGKFGREVSLRKCLVNITPGQGWGFDLEIHGVAHRVEGCSPLNVVDGVWLRLKANNVEGCKEEDIWANLNIFWMGLVNDRFHAISYTDFLDSLKVNHEPEPAATGVRHAFSEWSSLFWGMVEVYLCQDSYHWAGFRDILYHALNSVSPTITPALGDARVFKEFALEIKKLEGDPVYGRSSARKWFSETRSKITKQPYEGSPLWVR